MTEGVEKDQKRVSSRSSSGGVFCDTAMLRDRVGKGYDDKKGSKSSKVEGLCIITS